MNGLLRVAASLLALAAAPSAAASGGVRPPRRIVLVSIDTLRADRLRPELTPALSRFASGAAVFEEATTQATWTLPSHASMLTSSYPSTHGAGGRPGGPDQNWRPLSHGVATLAQRLKAAGYRTEALVSSPVLDPAWGFSRGFDSYAVGSQGEGGEELTLLDAAKRLRAPDPRPLFLFVHSNIVHSYARLKDTAAGPPYACPLTRADVLPDMAMRPAPDSPASPLCAGERRAYDRAARCMDAALSALLERLAQDPDALAIVTSDHGETLCESHPDTPLRGHGFAGYSEEVRVPLVVRWPGRAAMGRRLKAPVREIDVAATILDAAGAAVPASFRGRSLKPLLDGGALPEAASLSEGDGWRAARVGGWELIRRDGRPDELYELKDRAEAAEAKPDAAERTALRRALEALGAPAADAKGGRPVADERLRQALRAEGYAR